MYQYAKSLVKRFAGEKDGAALAEYGLLIGLIAVLCIGVVAALGTDIQAAFSQIGGAISGETFSAGDDV